MIRSKLIAPVVGMAVATAATGTAPDQTTVQMRAWAQVRPGEALTLAHAAEIVGPDAPVLAPVVLRESGDAGAAWAPASVSPDDVRRALRDLRGVDHARLRIRGGVCEVRVLPDAGGDAEGRSQPVEPGPPPSPVAGRPSVRDHVTAHLADLAGVSPEELRLTFDPQDEALLSASTQGRTVSVRALGLGERFPVNVTIYDGERVERAGAVRVGALARRRVAVSRADLRREDMLHADSVLVEERWLPLDADAAPPEAVVGSAARSRIPAGAVVSRRDLLAPQIVTKGELVQVHCVSGSVVLRTRARALEDGRDGELVRFELLTSPGVFQARMDGRGRAVTVATRTPAATDEEVQP